MEFRLTYEGRLLAASNNNKRPKHKHEIRKVLHRQLQRLWKETPHLRDARKPHDIIGSLALLTSGRRTALPRHRTLRATVRLEL